MGENELRAVSARGLYDRYFDQVSKYLVQGTTAEVLGSLATLFSPMTNLLEGTFSIKNPSYNPVNPFVIVGEDGAGLIHRPAGVEEIAVREIRMRGSKGPSFGDVTIRNINLSGTTIRVARR